MRDDEWTRRQFGSVMGLVYMEVSLFFFFGPLRSMGLDL